jgi:hypothetical protein
LKFVSPFFFGFSVTKKKKEDIDENEGGGEGGYVYKATKRQEQLQT